MKKTTKKQVCFLSDSGEVLICNCVNRYGDGQLWETESGKWIPIPVSSELKMATAVKQ